MSHVCLQPKILPKDEYCNRLRKCCTCLCNIRDPSSWGRRYLCRKELQQCLELLSEARGNGLGICRKRALVKGLCHCVMKLWEEVSRLHKNTQAEKEMDQIPSDPTARGTWHPTHPPPHAPRRHRQSLSLSGWAWRCQVWQGLGACELWRQKDGSCSACSSDTKSRFWALAAGKDRGPCPVKSLSWLCPSPLAVWAGPAKDQEWETPCCRDRGTWTPNSPSTELLCSRSAPILVHGITPLQLQGSALALVELHQVPLRATLQPVQVSLNGSTAWRCIHHFSQFSVISKLGVFMLLWANALLDCLLFFELTENFGNFEVWNTGDKRESKAPHLRWGFTTVKFNVKIIDIYKLMFLHGNLWPCFQTR